MMGTTVSAGYASAVEDGLCDLSVALQGHLVSNHWPPHSPRLIPFAVEAVARAAAGDWDVDIPLPDGIALEHRVTGQRRESLTASEAVDWLHLHVFVDAVQAGPDEPIHD